MGKPLAGMLASGMRALADALEILGLVPSNYMMFSTICSHSSRSADALFWPPQSLLTGGAQTFAHREYNKNNLQKEKRNGGKPKAKRTPVNG